MIGAVIWEPCPDLAGLQGKHVLITGASTGIGRQLALRYAQLGAKLTIAARRESKLQEVRALGLQAGSPGITVVRSDMGEAEDAESLASKAVAANGEIDVLVLNHALIDDSLVLEYTTEAALQRHVLAPMRVNFEGSVRLALSALPSLERSSGRIVVVSSGTAKTPAYFHAGYSASKSALHGFFNSMRAELRASGRGNVSVSLLVLGMIGTQEVLVEPNLRSMAMPVADCVSSMVCAERARVEEAFVPTYLWFVVRLNAFLPGVADWIMRNMYVYQIPSLVRRLEAAAARSVAERLGLANA